jgi:low temperature requirement protein LtrA
MRGRDPHETHRVATPLELLFDLTFATSFGLAAFEVASVLADGHVSAGLIGFGFAICWAWINFSWFGSAYDTDDWVFRLVTMVQVVGVLVLAAGLPRLFVSIEHGAHLDNSVMVLGYVIMRLALVFQWLRAADRYGTAGWLRARWSIRQPASCRAGRRSEARSFRAATSGSSTTKMRIGLEVFTRRSASSS